MKRLLFLLLLSSISTLVYSQEEAKDGKFRLGLGVFYTSEVESTGVNIKGVYEINEKWELSAGYSHVFENLGLTWDVIDVDANFIFYNNNKNVNVYALAGMAFTYWERQLLLFPGETQTGTYVGANLGIGTNIKLSERLNLAPELRWTMFDLDYGRMGLTFQYMF